MVESDKSIKDKAKEKLQSVGGSILNAMRLGRSNSPSDILVSLVTLDENLELKSKIKDAMAMSQLGILEHHFAYKYGVDSYTASVFREFGRLVRVNGGSEDGFLIEKVVDGLKGLNQLEVDKNKTEVDLFQRG